MPLDLEPLELEPVGSKLDLEPLDLEPVSDPRAARRADLQAQQAAARSAGETTSFSARAAAGIEQGLRTPEAMVRGGLDALQYYRALDAVTGSGDRFQRQNEAELRAMRDRDAFLARETQAIEGRDGRNFVGDLVQGVARGVVELPPQLMAGAAGAMRGAAVQASAAMGGVQGGLSQFAQERGEGRSQLEALPPAVASGLITAVTTRAFGDTGIESVFRNEGTQGFRRRLLGVLKDAGMEGAEEFVDQAQQDLLERVTRNPGKPLGESFYDTMQALAVGTVIGGAATAPRLIQRGNRPVIVNEQTGTTDFPPLDVDELPAPPVAAPAPNLDPDPALQTLSPATPPTAAAPASTAEVAPPVPSAPAAPTLNPTPNPTPISSSLTLEPVADVPDVPGVPPPLEGQPYDTALRTRPEATMETRPAAPLGLQREPTVSPELADTIQALRQGYEQEMEAQVTPQRQDKPEQMTAGVTANEVEFLSRQATRNSSIASQSEGGRGIAAGAGNIEYRWREAAVYDIKDALKAGKTLEEAAAIAKQKSKQTIANHNARRPKDYMAWQRWDESTFKYIDDTIADLRDIRTGKMDATGALIKPAPPDQSGGPTAKPSTPAAGQAAPAPPAKAEKIPWRVGVSKDEVFVESDRGRVSRFGWVKVFKSGGQWKAQVFSDQGKALHFVAETDSKAKATKAAKEWAQRQIDREFPKPTPPDQSGGPTELTPPAKATAELLSPAAGNPFDTGRTGRRLTELRETRPRPLDKYFGSKGGTPDERAAHEARIRQWNKEYRKAQAAHKLEVERSNDWLRSQPNPSAIDSAIAALEAAKVKPGGLYALPDLGLTVTLWNGTLTAAQVALRAGRTLAQAVQAGVDWLRAQGQAFDEAEVRKALEQGLLQAPGMREHVGKRLLQEDFSPAAKAALEPLLRYEVKPDAQLFAEAAAVVEAIGPMEAEANYWGNPWGLPADAHVVLGFAIGNGLSTLEAQARAAGETALADRIGRQNAEFQSQFVLQSTETARTLRAYRYFDLVGNLSPFTADLFARKVIERASQKQKQRIKPALDKGQDGEPGLTDRLNDINRTGIEEAARTPEVQGAARTAINQAIEEEAERKDTALERAITLEVSNTLETLPSVVRKANAAVLGAWDKLSAGEQVRQQTGRAGQGLENSLWSAVKQRGGTVSTVSSVIAQVNRALHEQVNRALGITPQQFVNPTTYLMRLRDALGNAEIMSRIWEQTRAAVGANLAAIGEMEGLLVRIESEIAELEAEAKTPLAGGPEVTAKDAKLKAQQQAARDEMLKGRNANLADAIKQRRDRIADVTAQLAEYRKMQPAWQAVMGMTVDVWGPNLLRGLLREQMKADGFRLRKAVADHFRGLAGAPDPLQSLGVLRDKLIAASGLDPQAAERLAKDLEAEYTAQVNKERARLAERLAKARELAKAKAAEREAKRPQLDAEALIDAYERRQTEWLKPTGRKSAVRAIVRQALREGAAVAGLNEQVVRGGVQAQLEAVGVPHEAAYRLAYEVWQERQAKGGGIEAVVAARVKELQLDLGRIIRQHWTQVDKAGESLAEHIVGETKMPAEQAERLATAIQRRFKALVQARKEQALRNLAKTPAARELQKPSVAQRIIEATNLGALDSEGLWQAVAEKLGLPTYTAEASAEVKRLADRAQQLPEGSVQRQEATARLMRFIARQKGVNLGDLGWAFWYANTLSGPITHAVNAFSNTLSLAGNVATQFRDVRGIPQILAATAKGFRTGLTEARAIVKQGPGANRTKFTEQGQALENLDPQDFTGAGLVSQWRYVARALAATDAAFYFPAREAKAITLARALARQEGKTGAAIRTRAQQILDGTEEQQNLWGAQVDRERAQLVAMGEKPDALWTTRRLEQLREQGWGADIGEAADDFALRTTYNNRPYGLIGTLADVAKFAQNRVPGARGVVPFVNVVANMVNDSINYTPWGFARAYAAGRTGEPSVTLSLPFEWAEKLREGKSPMTPDAVVDLHAKAALGTAMLGSLMALALANLDDDDGENFQLYGSGPKDAAARAALRETGWLPYSGRVNGKYVSFANTPLAIPLGALGHYLDAARYDKRFEQADAFNRLGVALWGGAHIITQQSFLDGLARLLGALEERRGRIDTASDRAVEQAFRSISSVAVPNALRQLDRLFDPTIYDTRGIEGALVAGIPFARRAGSPALNAFGEPITNEPWKRFASDAEANVWTDLARRKIYPSVADKAKNANGREMTDDEHYRYVQESGQAIKRRLETPGMRQMIRSGKEDDARKAVTAIVREERERARRRLGF